ncbi:hypothetical protein GYMLUDRAFT_70984 [Collybiopsis luxurians FD-317 M1]|nr:hypothetical protein GYMLUDRAFT_70984 [Collybiopsis luxurians FD-317 M1]
MFVKLRAVTFVMATLLLTALAIPTVIRSVDGEAWILDDYLTVLKAREHEVKDAFSIKLTGITHVTFMPPSERGLNNEGVYSVMYHDQEAVMKVMNWKNGGSEALGEVLALKDVGFYIASGLCTLSGQEKHVIIMKKIPGTPLPDTIEYKKEPSDEKRNQMKGEAIELMCENVADIVMAKKVLHYENTVDNTCVLMKDGKVGSARVCDFGPVGMYRVDHSVQRAQVIAWCKKRWTIGTWRTNDSSEMF